MKNLVERLQKAVSEVDELRDAFVTHPDVQKARERFREGAKVVGREADDLFAQMGRQTYDLIEKGKLQAPEPLRPMLDKLTDVLKPQEEAASSDEAEPARPEPAAPKEATTPKESATAKKPAAKKTTTAKKATAKKPAAKATAAKKPAAKKAAAAKKPAAKKATTAKKATKKTTSKKTTTRKTAE